MPMSKQKAPAKLAAPVVKSSAHKPTKTTIDESKTSVSGGDAVRSSQVETIEISSDGESDEDISDLEDTDQAGQANGEKEAAAKPAAALTRANGEHARRGDADAQESDAEPTAPSFGELLRDNGVIDVPALVQSSVTSNAATQRPRTTVAPSSHQSLATVLGQALRTDDTELLESCLHTNDLTTVRNTIELIDSSLAGTLLIKLAARIHRRPGRLSTLGTWVQWALVAHGGALASQPEAVQSLSSLQKVLAERVKGLNSLLALKGRLDLLGFQMDLRTRLKRRPDWQQEGGSGNDQEDVIWVEGEADATSDKDLSNGIGARRKRNANGDDDDSSDDNEGVPVTNGLAGDSEAEEDSDADNVSESVDAEEPLDGDEVEHGDEDESMGEDDESDAEAASPPHKMQKVAKMSLSKRN